MTLYPELNPEQRAAVLAPIGPVLVRAGAGSGKTRVLTLRIRHLIVEHGVAPASILAVTFTNKAATELRQRLQQLLGGRARGLTSGTFHSIGLRILRESIAGRLKGYTRDFSIYGEEEQRQLAQHALESWRGRAPIALEPDHLLSRISRLKSRLISPQLAARMAGADAQAAYIAALYDTYQRALRRHNAIDFDDCIVLPYRLLSEDPELLEAYQQRWRHVLVDEYQDTDRAQHGLVRLLTAAPPRSLFVVGDAQQSIYGFRNADHTIITQFQQDFPDARVIELVTNYRSRQQVLDAAHAVIRHARAIHVLPLRAAQGPGLPGSVIKIQEHRDGRDEAEWLARQVSGLIGQGRQPREIAVLFRTRHMSRGLEQAMRHARVPYLVRGTTGFYDRRVVRDLLAYLRAIANPGDSLSLARIINLPPRGIGGATLEQFTANAARYGLPPGEALFDPRCYAGLKPAAITALQTFAAMLRGWRERAARGYPPAHLIADVRQQSGYEEWVRSSLPEAERADALSHLQELQTAAEEHETLAAFLQEIALLTAVDDRADERDAVHLLTIHAAKGLEWPIVFVVGLEEGTLPHARALDDAEGIEEERRLCYVAITRAREQLWLSWAAGRQRGVSAKRSRFLDEIIAYGQERARSQARGS
ncbi:ATP-dependent helicase [Kallotenue papyrolyticum]|uniref:ATP-dependent helicase n=1 Tax=Kallotenue papyrolyticum TaxID=1325125 RepID=UPI0004785305|nr:UvrD-helicase domain-containing protein [Kallotenue papyrolyticum]